MNLYSKIISLVLFLSASLIFGEALILDKELLEEGLYTCTVENSELYVTGDLIDIYGEQEEINGRQYWKNYIDTLVVIDVDEDSIVLEPLWNGAGKNLEDGFYMIRAERNIETETPDILQINMENIKVKRNKIERDQGLSFHFDSGLEYDFIFEFGVFMGASINFGNSSINTSIHASTSIMWLTFMDLTYNYNLPIHENFDLFFGGGVVTNIYLMDYSYAEITDIVGIALETGLLWRTGLFFDLGLNIKYYGFISTYSGMIHNMIIGVNVDF